MLKGITPRGSGDIYRGGQRIRWQEFGRGPKTVLLLPTWSIVHSDHWRHQVPFLSEHYRVIAFDGLGNGGSDRPTDPSYYGAHPFADDAVAVLDATRTERAAIAGVSQGAAWALSMVGRYPARVAAAIFVASAVPLAHQHPERAEAGLHFDEKLLEHPGWAKWNRHFWLRSYAEFLGFFFSKCFTEPDSTAQIEHFLEMGLETTPEVLLATAGLPANNLDRAAAEAYARSIRCPALVVHGDADAVAPVEKGIELAELSRAQLEIMAGAGHEPECRFPAEFNAMLADFLRHAPW